jgi:hypothetical protein
VEGDYRQDCCQESNGLRQIIIGQHENSKRLLFSFWKLQLNFPLGDVVDLDQNSSETLQNKYTKFVASSRLGHFKTMCDIPLSKTSIGNKMGMSH